MSLPLYWHCVNCGAHESVEATEPAYERGDWEKCECGGAARVMTLAEGARLEQLIALGFRDEAKRLAKSIIGDPK